MEDIQIEQLGMLGMLAFSKGVLDKEEDYQDMEEQLGMLQTVRNTQFVVVDIQLELEQVLDKEGEDHQDMEELLLRNTQ